MIATASTRRTVYWITTVLGAAASRAVIPFQLQRRAGGEVAVVPHLIDSDSGVGTQVTVGKIQ